MEKMHLQNGKMYVLHEYLKTVTEKIRQLEYKAKS